MERMEVISVGAGVDAATRSSNETSTKNVAHSQTSSGHSFTPGSNLEERLPNKTASSKGYDSEETESDSSHSKCVQSPTNKSPSTNTPPITAYPIPEETKELRLVCAKQSVFPKDDIPPSNPLSQDIQATSSVYTVSSAKRIRASKSVLSQQNELALKLQENDWAEPFNRSVRCVEGNEEETPNIDLQIGRRRKRSAAKSVGHSPGEKFSALPPMKKSNIRHDPEVSAETNSPLESADSVENRPLQTNIQKETQVTSVIQVPIDIVQQPISATKLPPIIQKPKSATKLSSIQKPKSATKLPPIIQKPKPVIPAVARGSDQAGMTKTKSPATKAVTKTPAAQIITGVKVPRLSATELWSGIPDDPLDGGWPPGWTKKLFQRASGATKGSTDRYWYSPVTGKKFRSMAEIKRFMPLLQQCGGNEDAAWAMLKGK